MDSLPLHPKVVGSRCSVADKAFFNAHLGEKHNGFPRNVADKALLNAHLGKKHNGFPRNVADKALLNVHLGKKHNCFPRSDRMAMRPGEMQIQSDGSKAKKRA